MPADIRVKLHGVANALPFQKFWVINGVRVHLQLPVMYILVCISLSPLSFRRRIRLPILSGSSFISTSTIESGTETVNKFQVIGIYMRIHAVGSPCTVCVHVLCSTRPFLSVMEKRWIAFQLLKALDECHVKKVTQSHGLASTC